MAKEVSTAEGSPSLGGRPIGEATSLAKQAVTSPQLTPNSAKAATSAQAAVQGDSTVPGGGEPPAVDLPVRVVQFSILFDGDEEKFEHLWAMRDCMHRALNVAISEWHRADKVASKRDSSKMTPDRGSVTQAVKTLLASERSYWAGQLPKLQGVVEKLRVNLGSAKAKAKSEDDRRVTELDHALIKVQKDCLKARVRSAVNVPSSVYDSVVRFTQSKHAQYLKAAFRGDRSLDSFRSGQPIRWRDGSWKIGVSQRKKGAYELELELDTDGKRVRRGTFQILPDGPAMYGFAKQMVSGQAQLCDARVVYSEKKKQWFAKLTIRTDSTPNWVRAVKAAPKPWTGVAALRRGVNHAFVIIFEDGSSDKDPQCRFISGGDVLHFKRKLKARKESLGKHLDKLELGPAARGRGKRRRFAALQRIDDGEARFVDWRCKTWGVEIARECARRGVGRLLVSSMNLGEFNDGGDDFIKALLYQWPFAKMRDQVESACKKIGVEVEEFDAAYNARTCPKCKHVNARRQSGEMFNCDGCELERPADQIVAWNGLVDAVGKTPIEKGEAQAKSVGRTLKKKKS
jgi:transposase